MNSASSLRSVIRRSRVASPTRREAAQALSGLAGRDALRGMLARLQPKEEVLLLGWGVPMPLPVRSRRYDDKFWEELGVKGGKRGEKEIKEELGF
jgi:hypothetical protein